VKFYKALSDIEFNRPDGHAATNRGTGRHPAKVQGFVQMRGRDHVQDTKTLIGNWQK